MYQTPDDCPAYHDLPKDCPFASRLAKLDSMQADIKAVKDIIEAWNDTKGFIRTVQVMGKLLLWLAAISGTIWWMITGKHL